MQMPEELAPDAAAVLAALLAGPGPVFAALRAQIPHARVTGRCGCGCVTVDLEVDRAAAEPAPPHGSPVVEASFPVAPVWAGVVALTHEGYLSGLEVYSVADAPVTAWPDPRLLVVDVPGE
ncbi:hypothetical protein [Streptomyces sp. HB2AG]|uniref:hypothetical protein n=1 Tax=Streptomyces sp. HB2AG TaxID=2983400 RepID=UPI0022AA8100|nr:hypothetical protein [Streptomyces sp. HB2AG]MCZ2527688.1 hypothetical protein [Streptomyces sp. HB2AG]